MSLTAEQVEVRKAHVSVSEIATIAGLNKWETPTELVLRKRNQLPAFEGNSKTRAGHAFESVIAHMVAERTGTRLRRSNITLSNEAYPWLVGHIDRKYEGVQKGLEIKNVGPAYYFRGAWGADGSDEVPDWYLPQPHGYMLLSGYPAWDVAAFFGGDDMRMYPLERDADIRDWILETTRDFYERYILGPDVPEIDPNHPHALDALKIIHKAINKLEVQGDDRILHWHRVRMDAKDQVAQLEKVIEVADAQILKVVGDAGTLHLPDGTRYERRSVERKGFTVETMSYIQLKHIKPRAKKESADE